MTSSAPEGLSACTGNLSLERLASSFATRSNRWPPRRLDTATLGWHGVEGDRRLAFRRLADRGGLPWLTASRFPELLLYQPFGRQANASEPLPSHIRTPAGKEFALADEALAREVSSRCGGDVQLMHLKHGIFDEGSVSLIALSTIRNIERELGRAVDIRRFRPNIILETRIPRPFEEDSWVGKDLEFGDGNGPIFRVTTRDMRCVMINLDPVTAEADPELMKTVVRLNETMPACMAPWSVPGELHSRSTCQGRE